MARAAREGSRRAAEALSERLRFVPRVCAALNTRFGRPFSREELEDLSQDTLLVIWRKLDSFEGLGPLEAWVQRFCQLEFMNRLRKTGRRGRTDALTIEVPDPSPPAPTDLARSERIEAALEELPSERSVVIRLRHFEGWRLDRVAAHLGIPENTAKTRYHRGILQLRQRLRGREDGERGIG